MSMAELVEVLGKLKRVTTVGIPKYVWDNTTPQSFLGHHWSTRRRLHLEPGVL
jgi:hypothetical protein